MRKSGDIKQFDIYNVDLNPTVGAEIKKNRPAVVISPNVMNKNLGTVIIAPMTHTVRGFPSRVPSLFEGQVGEIVLDQIRAVDKSRLVRKKGNLNKSTQAEVKAVLGTMFS